MQVLRRKREFSSKGCWRWMTRKTLIEKYQSEETADEIIQNKTSDDELKESQVKPHPDAPNNPVSCLSL